MGRPTNGHTPLPYREAVPVLPPAERERLLEYGAEIIGESDAKIIGDTAVHLARSLGGADPVICAALIAVGGLSDAIRKVVREHAQNGDPGQPPQVDGVALVQALGVVLHAAEARATAERECAPTEQCGSPVAAGEDLAMRASRSGLVIAR